MQEYTSDYTKFDAEAYLSHYKSVEWDPIVGQSKVDEMQWLHETFATNQIKGRRLLDIRTGPTIHTVISASAHVDEIFLSDFAPQNREMLKKWLDGTLHHSFESFFRYVVDQEGKGENPKDRESMLRQKVAGICHIDLLDDYPLSPSVFPKFDVITTALCIVSVAENQEMYEKIAKRVANMLQDGGHLILFSVYGCIFYDVGNFLFKSLEISGEKVLDIWKDCGLEIIEWKQESSPVTEDNRHRHYYFMVARKVKSLI